MLYRSSAPGKKEKNQAGGLLSGGEKQSYRLSATGMMPVPLIGLSCPPMSSFS
jgi:hypothetical protein